MHAIAIRAFEGSSLKVDTFQRTVTVKCKRLRNHAIGWLEDESAMNELLRRMADGGSDLMSATHSRSKRSEIWEVGFTHLKCDKFDPIHQVSSL